MDGSSKPEMFRSQNAIPSDDDEDDEKPQMKMFPSLTKHGYRIRVPKCPCDRVIVVPTRVRDQNKLKSICKFEEDDGIYRPETLENHLPRSVVVRIEERLKRESLYDQAKGVIFAPDPFAKNPVRPLLGWYPQQAKMTHWADADKTSILYAELCVRIPMLHLTDHGLFTLEDSLSLQLRFLHHEYNLKYAAITSLNHRYSRLMELSSSASIHDLYSEVNGFVCILAELQDSFEAVYTKWKEIKDLRQKQLTNLTPVVLSLRKVDGTGVQDCIQSFIKELQIRGTKDDHTLSSINTLGSFINSPCLDYIIRLTSDISIVTQPSQEENNRREHIRSTRVFCELLVNNSVVMTTKKTHLTWPNFTVDFNEQILLRVVAKPSTISLRIYECAKPMGARIPKTFYRTVCWTSIPIPLLLPGQAFEREICAVGAAPTDEWYQFCHEAPIPRKHWSQSYLNSSYYANANRHIKGAVHVHLSWKTNQEDDGKYAMRKIPIKLQSRINKDKARLIGHRPTNEYENNDGTHFTHERDFFIALSSLPTLDPNATADQPAMKLQMYHEHRAKRLQEFEVFRLYPITSFELSGCHGKSTLKRHKLLQLRDKKPLEYAIFSVPIPLSEHNIAQQPTYLELVRPEVQTFNRGLASDKLKAHTKNGLEYTKRQLEIRRHDFMERVRSSHTLCKRSAQDSPYSQLSTIVQEYPTPLLFKGWTPDFSGLSQLLAPKRSLRPAKKIAPPLSGLAVDRPDECRIYVQVQRMTNAHVRRTAQQPQSPPPKKLDDDESNSDAESNDEDTSIVSLNHIAVEVCFQGNSRKTSCSSGAHPMWMETVILPFKPPLNDWSSGALTRIRDTIQFNIMDQIIVEDGITHAKDTQLRYLGGVSVPFSTLYFNRGEIVAQLQCNVPHFHLGYTRKMPKSKKDLSSEAATYLSVMIKLDPPLATPAPADTPVQLNNEPVAFLHYAEKWLCSIPNLTLQHIFVPTVSGSHAFVTQYLKPQAPPTQLTSIAAAARFVSLIPFLEDWHTYPGAIDVWASTQDFLDLQVGDWEEHAILLCNYFNYIDQMHKTIAKSYLLLGCAVPEGNVVYVLRQTIDESTLWNACTGASYNLTDSKCPLHSVLFVAAHDNIWANLCKDSPTALAWNAIETDTKLWKPFFTPHTSKDSLLAILPPFQQTNPIYQDTPSSFIHDVEVELLESIKMSVRKWRSSHSTTVFNSDVSFHLKESLRTFEAQVVENSSSDIEATVVTSKYPRFSFHGAPFCFPFMDIPQIVDAIHNTKVHTVTTSGVEFALAVHVHAYPNLVLAVWVYYTAMLPNA